MGRSAKKTLVLVAIPVALALMGQATCEPLPDKSNRVNFNRAPTARFSSVEGQAQTKPIPSVYGHLPNHMTQICTGADKAVCEWVTDPNEPLSFEHYGPTTGYRPLIEDNPSHADNLVRCAKGDTYAGICDSWLGTVAYGAAWNAKAVTVADIGDCSISLPTEFFVSQILEQFQIQSDERLGEQRDPQGEDVVLWTDFVLNLRDSEEPFRAWTDYTYDEDGLTRSEVIIEGEFWVDGDIEFAFDPDWLGSGTAGAILSTSLQLIWFTNPWLVWTVFLGNCEKDRPMAMQFRGSFEATSEGGIGLRINDSNSCGVAGNQPCSWTYVYPWPARPLCNNQVKPRIEREFTDGFVAAMTHPATGEPACLTCREDGSSLLPFTFNGEPIKVERVVHLPNEVVLVLLQSKLVGPYKHLYDEYKARGWCDNDRSMNSEGVVLTAGGLTL